MPYFGASSENAVRRRFTYLASASATSISGADANGQVLAFQDGSYVDVYLNGVKLKTGEDYDTATANTINNLSALSLNDEVEIIVYELFNVADTVSKTDGGTFNSAVAFSGGLNIADGGNIGSASDTDAISISSTGDVTLTQDLKIKDGGTIGSASDADAISIASTGDITLTQNLKVKDGGTIGSASDADAITIASDGKVTLAETVTVSKGIKFPATQVASTDANTLDDYEEGTWTPTVVGGTTAGTYETATANGFYQKIGRDVTVRAVVQLAGSISAGGTGSYLFGGLPFNIDVSDNAGAGSVLTDSVQLEGSSNAAVYALTVSNASGTDGNQLRILHSLDGDVSFVDLDIDKAAANDFFEFTYNYRTTA